MDETTWLTCSDPARMISEFGLCADHRRTRLLLVAHCRRGWEWLSDTSRRAVESADRFTDGLATTLELETIREETMEEVSYFGVALAHNDQRSIEYEEETQFTFVRDLTEQEQRDESELRIRLGATAFADAAVWPEYRRVEPFFWELLPDERRPDAQLLRCIFGNPIRPVAFAPAWRSETAVSLAAGIYAERAFDRLPILADALEEAGCDQPDVLAHCRGPGPHPRGCWVVDAVLGKE